MATKTSSKSTATKTVPAPKAEKTKTKHDRVALAIIIGILVFFALAYFFKGYFVVATVNGEPITRMDVVNALEKQGGKQVLESMITKKLILQEAKKNNIVATQEDIDKEIAVIEASLKKQKTTLDDALTLQGMTREQLVEDIRLQVLIQKLVNSKITVNDDEIKKYIEDNAEFYPEGTTEEDKLKEASASLRQQKIQFETQRLISELQGNSKTIILFKY